MAYHDLLGCSPEAFARLEEHFERRVYDGVVYRHLSNHRGEIERGTVLFDETVVRGYPKVPRTLVLSPGVERHFGGEVALEEKLNGYNVRVTRIDGRVLAFSRSGLVCPFTTRILERRLDVDLRALFDAHPTAMVCGEMIGPENPYTAHDYPGVDSLAFRAFDWRNRESGEPLAVAERRDRYDEFDVPQTPLFGVYDAESVAEECQRVVCELDEAGREGVVMKSVDGETQLKYTTAAANRDDLAFAFSLPFDYGQEFMFRRLVREGFQSLEFEESPTAARERARHLGEAILLPMIETIETVDDGGAVGERHTVRADAETIDALLDHLDEQGLTLEIDSDRQVDGESGSEDEGEGESENERVVTFTKRVHSTNDKIRSYLEGHIVRE